MSNIRGGHKKLILSNLPTSPINDESISIVGIVHIEYNFHVILTHYYGRFARLRLNPDKHCAIMSDAHNIYLSVWGGSIGITHASDLGGDWASGPPLELILENVPDSAFWFLVISSSTSIDAREQILIYNSNPYGHQIRKFVYDVGTSTIVTNVALYTSQYNHRSIYIGGTSILSNVNPSVTWLYSKMSPHWMNNRVGRPVGVACSTYNKEVYIYSTVETLDYDTGSGALSIVANNNTYLTLDNGINTTEISNRIPTTKPMNNVTVNADSSLSITDTSYGLRGIVWNCTSEGRVLCGTRMPLNTAANNVYSNTHIHISYNYGVSFEPEIILNPNASRKKYYKPTDAHIGANGNMILVDCFEYEESSINYSDNMAVNIFNVYTKQLTSIDSDLYLYANPGDVIRACAFEIDSAGTHIVIGCTIFESTGHSRARYHIINIEDVNCPYSEFARVFPVVAANDNDWACQSLLINF